MKLVLWEKMPVLVSTLAYGFSSNFTVIRSADVHNYLNSKIKDRNHKKWKENNHSSSFLNHRIV